MFLDIRSASNVVVVILLMMGCASSSEESTSSQQNQKGNYTFCQVNAYTHGCCSDLPFPMEQTPYPGMWVRGESVEKVYYVGSNSRLYHFPTAWTMISWGYDFSDPRLFTGSADVCGQVVQVPDSKLEALSIGGNVTYRPGTFFTGIAADVGRYLVNQGRTLLHVGNNAVIPGIYPGDLPDLRLRLLPEPFFTNYELGPTVNSPAEFDARAIFDQATLETETVGL